MKARAMATKASLAIALLGAPAALAQSYQTALPLTSAERHAVEARLSTILDHASEGEVARFALPTGRTVDVRSYRKVVRNDGEPCRGYRIDLSGPEGSSAVDGFRCRRRDGRAWVIVEPEIVLSRSDSTAGVPATVTPVQEVGPGAERIEDTVVSLRTAPQASTAPDLAGPLASVETRPPSAPPPLPRPAPERPQVSERTAPIDDGTVIAGGPLPDVTVGRDDEWETQVLVSDGEAESLPTPLLPSAGAAASDAPIGPLAAVGEPAQSRAPASTSFLDQVSRAVDGTASTAADDPDVAPQGTTGDDGGDTVVAALPLPDVTDPATAIDERESAEDLAPEAQPAAVTPEERPARVVARVEETPGLLASGDQETDEAVITALKALDYLPAVDEVSPAILAAAVDEYALDERFTLPIETGELLDRLLDTLDRNDTVLDCEGEEDSALCFEAG